MSRIYINEFGKRLLISTPGIDYSGQTNIELHASAQGNGTSFVNSASVSVLGADTTTSAGDVISASAGVEYVINDGDFDGAGVWRFHLVVDFGATKRLISTPFEREVFARGDS